MSKWLLVVGLVMAGRTAVAAELEAPREVPRFELAQPKLELERRVRFSVVAAATDLGLRVAEVGVGYGLYAAAKGVFDDFLAHGAIGSAFGGLALIAVFFVYTLYAAIAAPAVNAKLVSLIDGSHSQPSTAALMVTSYASHAIVDGLLLGFSMTGAPMVGLLAFCIGSAVGSAAMGVAYGVSATAVSAPQIEVPAVPWGPAIPTATSPGFTLRF